MAGISCCILPNPLRIFPRRRIYGLRCCSSAPNKPDRETQTPQLLKMAVTGVTEILRLFSSDAGKNRLTANHGNSRDEMPISDVNEVLSIIKSDYEKAYFVTGLFTSAIYAEDCIFEDPTIKFRGKELYSRNLNLLVPFFDNPSIELNNIEKGVNSEAEFIVASWKLRTYLNLPWKPYICIDGSTVYDLDERLRVVKHVESWEISALEAIGRIFTPSFGRTFDD